MQNQQLTKEEKLKKLKQMSSDLQEKFEKKGYAAKLGFLGDEHMQGVGVYELMPTGIPSIDKFLGGGVPRGCHIHLVGNPDVGKTTVALNIIGNAQKAGLVCGFADLEGKFDKAWARKQGVNTDELVFGQFDVAEDAFEWVKNSSSLADIIIVDSVVALASRKMVQNKKGTSEKDFDDETMGVLAKLMAQYLRIAQPTVVKNRCTVVLINHLYDKIGDMYGGKTTSGGNAIKYWETLELWLSKTKLPAESEFKDLAYNLKATIKKGHYTGAPHENSFVETLFFNREGFSPEYEMFIQALADGYITNDGTNTFYTSLNGETHKTRGFKEAKVFSWLKETNLMKDIQLRYLKIVDGGSGIPVDEVTLEESPKKKGRKSKNA